MDRKAYKSIIDSLHSMRPKPTNTESLYETVYIYTEGSIDVTGDLEISIDEVYSLIASDAERSNYSIMLRDVMEMGLWAVVQSPSAVCSTESASSKFFGPSAIKRVIRFPQEMLIMTKRKSFPKKREEFSIESESQWEMYGSDWFMKVSLKGWAQAAEKGTLHLEPFCKTGIYVRSDKYNSYKGISSEFMDTERIEGEDSNF
ncbi:TPA_asm: M [Carrot gammacytorhabdovirus 1]|nr:TPA_asm: M [Carrot gammacytorhabdovirus 1]